MTSGRSDRAISSPALPDAGLVQLERRGLQVLLREIARRRIVIDHQHARTPTGAELLKLVEQLVLVERIEEDRRRAMLREPAARGTEGACALLFD